MTMRRDPARSAVADRCLDAAARCIERVGVRKTSLDDVAREAGCARATLYRHFPGKDALLTELFAREARALAGELSGLAATAPTLEAAAVDVTVAASRTLQAAPALQRVLAVEPEVLHPFLAFDGASLLLVRIGSALGPCFERFLPATAAERLAEWLARLVLPALVEGPGSAGFDPSDPGAVRTYLASFVLPGFVPAVHVQGATA